MRFAWDFLIGPVLTLLPAFLRKRIASEANVDWNRAGMVSGIYEMLAAVIGLGYWYMFEMNLRMGQILTLQINQPSDHGLTEHQVSGAALLFFYLHPLTWLLFYFFFEGAVRMLGAGFSENVLGSLPFWLISRPFLWGKPRDPRSLPTARQNARSIAASVREKVLVIGRKELPDELESSNRDGEEFLEIRASHKKDDWVAPKTVRVGDTYYRLEQTSVTTGDHPFLYRLRKLPAGVPGRTVILYR
jgi:hypothetical protein